MRTPPRTAKQTLIERLVPLYALYPVRFELSVVGVRLRSGRERRRFAEQRELRVNIGAGGAGRPGWVNVDLWEAPNITCRYDCRRSLPFADGSVALLFSEHFLEHLDYAGDVPRFLAECHRVVRPGGCVRFVVPDMERYLRAYCEGGWDALRRLRGIDREGRDSWFPVTYDSPMEVVNFLFRQFPPEPHAYGYDFETLAGALQAAGFTEAERREFADGREPGLLLDEPARRDESLYVEAIR